jgi:hypothetical protein
MPCGRHVNFTLWRCFWHNRCTYNYECDTTGILIDTLVFDLTNRVDDDHDISVRDDSTAWFLRSRKSRRWRLWSSPQANKTPFSTTEEWYIERKLRRLYPLLDIQNRDYVVSVELSTRKSGEIGAERNRGGHHDVQSLHRKRRHKCTPLVKIMFSIY